MALEETKNNAKPLPWFRMYTEAVDDEKLRLLAFEDRWHFIALLCCKGKGILDEPASELRSRKVALKLGLSVRELEEVVRRLADVELVDRETMQPSAWDDRQFNSDRSTERTRAYRERMKRHGDVTVTAQDTDTDTDTDKEKTIRPKRAKRFQPPSVDQVSEYVRDKGFPVDPATFVDFYTANGWVQGRGKPIKDWKAAVRYWATRNEGEQPRPAKLVIPDGNGVDTRSALWKLCQEAGITADEVKDQSLDKIRGLIRARHPGGDAGSKGFRLIQGGVAA